MTTNFLDRGFVIWGCGTRFLRAASIVLLFRAVAIIDNNPAYRGRKMYGLPVVDQETYVAEMQAYPVLITPLKTGGIIAFLQAHGVQRYFFLDEVIAPVGRSQVFKDSEDAMWRTEKLAALVRLKDAWLVEWTKIGIAYFSSHFLNQRKEHGINKEEIVRLLQNAKHPVLNVMIASVRNVFRMLLQRPVQEDGDISLDGDVLILPSLGVDVSILRLAMQAEQQTIPIVFSEDGFLRSIEPGNGTHGLPYTQGHSLMLDMGGLYIHADSPSMFEDAMNSERELSPEELARARRLMEKIHVEHLSKYNHQPRLRHALGTAGKEHILVVDQVFADKSIAFGWATDDTFREMLDAALRENPEAEIFIKAHPVKSQGHFADVVETDRIHLLTEPMNPIDLIDQMDKVYVCTSQLGFEAAFCGKEVHVFGMPFYAGWGFTIDAQTHPRRVKRRTVEEAFYFAYITCSVYVSYETQSVCEIEQAIDELLALRTEYQANISVTT